MLLYDSLYAPNPRRVRIFADEKGIALDKIEVNILKGENLRPEYLAVNPRAHPCSVNGVSIEGTRG